MKFTKPRATLEELLEFCNRVRDAGGGNPLDALMPAVPHDVTQCLIAKNLNFNCGVGTTYWRGKHRWVMMTTDKDVRNRIATQLGLAKINKDHGYLADWGQEPDDVPMALGDLYGVVLPEEIGRVAIEFDCWIHAAEDPDRFRTDEQKALLKEFLPYVTESIREVQKIGKLNDKGELVL